MRTSPSPRIATWSPTTEAPASYRLADRRGRRVVAEVTALISHAGIVWMATAQLGNRTFDLDVDDLEAPRLGSRVAFVLDDA